MFAKLKDLWSRLKVRWHVLAVALLAATPEILNYLGLVDFKPLLLKAGVSEAITNLVVGALPFLLVFLKSAFAVEPKDPAE